MTIFERIDLDLKTAMKAKNETVLGTLRLVRSALKNRQIDIQHELTDEEALAILRTMVKQYRDALADFVAAGRQDLVEKQQKEIAILEEYLPAAMPEAELRAICERVIRDLNATPKEMGKVIGAIMKEVDGRADGNVVRSIVQQLFS